ncbi:MAG TPA: hypothetical protein VI997_00770 [Candidatus Thermoplasmatota archaeon]|nr:hypothetical protein [Candidatus Thermoplasmatota archaeon]
MALLSRALPLLALAAILLVPPASADHVYSHQYRVFGRVVDTDGQPLSGAVVFLELQKNQDLAKISFASNCNGDYGFAANEHFHTHGLSTVAEIRATVVDPSRLADLGNVTIDADRNLRKSHLDWRLPDAGNLTRCPGAGDENARSVLVFGRLWNVSRETSLEGITVWGTIPGGCRQVDAEVRCQEVEVTVTPEGGSSRTVTAYSNNYGDYRAWVAFDEAFGAATAQATWLNKTASADVDATLHTAMLDFIEGTPAAPRQAPLGVGVLAVAAAAAALAFGRRRA